MSLNILVFKGGALEINRRVNGDILITLMGPIVVIYDE